MPFSFNVVVLKAKQQENLKKQLERALLKDSTLVIQHVVWPNCNHSEHSRQYPIGDLYCGMLIHKVVPGRVPSAILQSKRLPYYSVYTWHANQHHLDGSK